MSVFDKYKAKAYPYNYAAEIHVATINGGTPTDPNVAEGWLRSKLGVGKDDLIREAVAEIMVERGVDAEAAAEIVAANRHLNGFKRDERGLYIEGRQLKSAIKEAANIRWPNGRWSFDKNGRVRLVIKTDGEKTSGKITRSFIAEHVSVQDVRVPLGVVGAVRHQSAVRPQVERVLHRV